MSNKAKQPKPEERRYGSFWHCLTCADDQERGHADMMKHLQEKHGIDTKTAQGNRQALRHLDGSDWFSWEYEWIIGEVKAHQHLCQKRSGR
jgi:hypothetical protein